MFFNERKRVSDQLYYSLLSCANWLDVCEPLDYVSPLTKGILAYQARAHIHTNIDT